jgi:chromosome segregation ATPase
MTIETAMWFALGFLVAAVLALVLMASLWRRAVRLTTRRIAASVPADAEAALAEKDLLSARFARDLSRYELALSDLRRRNTEERVAVGRQTIALDEMRQARDAETARVEAGLAREAAQAEVIEARDATIRARDEDLALARATIGRLEETIADHETTIGSLENRVEERNVEIAARKTEADAREVRIEGILAELAEKKDRIDELRKTLGLAETVVSQEKDRADRLDRRIERLVADVADREELADRRHRELERSRQALTSANARIAALTRSVDAANEPTRLGDNMERSVDLLEQQKIELETRLDAAERERDRLAAAVRDLERSRSASPGDGAATRAALREQMADLAAEMVRLTASVEGAGSPIAGLVDGKTPGEGPRPSLADRIRAVRAAGQTAQSRGRNG